MFVALIMGFFDKECGFEMESMFPERWFHPLLFHPYRYALKVDSRRRIIVCPYACLR